MSGFLPQYSPSLIGLPLSSTKVRSAGTCALRCCSMPTFSNRGGRVFAGGDMTPLLICAEAEIVKAKASRALATAKIELCFLLFTDGPMGATRLVRSFIVFRFFRGILAGCSLWQNRQSALREQIHRSVDGNPHRAGVLVDPAIAVEFVFFVHQDAVQLTALVFFQSRAGESGLRISPSHVPRVLRNLLHQRIWRCLRRPFTMVKIGVKSLQPKHRDHGHHQQSEHEINNARSLQILMLEAAVSL